MTSSDNKERSWNVLIFGLEKVGLTAPAEPIRNRNFTIYFEPFHTSKRFNEYDGVVVFQGVFESFERKTGYYNSYLTHNYDEDELDKRKKEATILLNGGGFLAFVLNCQFIDRDDRRDFRGTDLAKYHLNYHNLHRTNYEQRVTHLEPCISEFARFLELYGAAYTKFTCYNDSIEFHPLARSSQNTVGMVIDRQQYFIPSLIPDNHPKVLLEYFNFLVDAVTSVSNKLRQALPDWISAFKFNEELGLEEERAMHMRELARIDDRIKELSAYKAALVHTGEVLVKTVSSILTAALGVSVDTKDEFREDATLLNEEGNAICVCEIKGINRGVAREHINQTDSHRERSGYADEFPALLIANTLIKSAKNIGGKDHEIALEQVCHAVKMRILIMRTIDLLGLFRLILAGELSKDDALSMILNSTGWLRVVDNRVVIVNGDNSS